MRTTTFFSNQKGTAYEPISRLPVDDTQSEDNSEMSVLDRAAAEAGDWVGSHPTICVAVGMAIGVTVGWLIKRK